MSEQNGFKEVQNLEKVEQTLKEIRKSWRDICDTFGVDAELKIQPEVIRNNLRATMIDLLEIENLDYVKKSGKPLEKLHRSYLTAIIRFAYSNVETEETSVWMEEVERYLKEVITNEVLFDTGLSVSMDENVSLEQLFADIQRVFSISSQLNIIRGMESGSVSPEMFMNLEDNFIYLGIGIVQTCNGNVVVMGKVLTFIKTLIKINDNILKSISQMLSR